MIERFAELVAEHGVVGAQLAVLQDGQIRCAAAGVLNNVTGEPVTDDSLFQVASITKVFTATLVQQLVEEGRLDLDRPVRDVLPDFRLADEQAARTITPRQLLCHTAGFTGDDFFDTGTGDDAVARYVGLLADSAQVHTPGQLFSYCNNGYVVLGRIVEVLRGRPFNAVLRDRLIDPLGLNAALTFSDTTGASGHLRDEGEYKPVTELGPESDWPSGSALAMSARDLLGFARMHLDTKAFDVLREHQVTPPDIGFSAGWGLGWMLFGNGVIGHDGTGIGQRAFLRVVPETGVAVALLTNSASKLLAHQVFQELLGDRVPDLPTPPAEPVPIRTGEIVGTYRSPLYDLHVTAHEDKVRIRQQPRTGLAATLQTTPEREYVGLREDALISTAPEDGVHHVVGLIRDEQGRCSWLHYTRAAVRL